MMIWKVTYRLDARAPLITRSRSVFHSIYRVCVRIGLDIRERVCGLNMEGEDEEAFDLGSWRYFGSDPIFSILRKHPVGTAVDACSLSASTAYDANAQN